MRKNLKMFLTVCAFAFAVLLVSGTQSKAAQKNMSLRQTDASSNSITLEWNGPIADHYDVKFSDDGKNWETVDYTFSQSILINRLSSGRVCYAQVVAMNGSHGSSETIKDVSETATVATSPVKVQGLAQTGATPNSISMSWSPVAGVGSYNVYASVNFGDWQKVATSTTTSATINGLSPSSEIRYQVAAVRAVTGGQVIGEESENVYMRTVPAKVSRIAMTNYWDSLAEGKYEWTSTANVDGYQYQVQKSNGKKTYFSAHTSSPYFYAKPFPKGVFVRARARAYITIGSKKLYGAWSGYAYTASNKKMTAKRIAKGKKISLKWKKISGACGYKVYISTKSNSGFKKVKTLSSKKTKYTITKCGKKKLKKKKVYYVQLRYMTKVGKKKVTSPIVSSVTVL